jgi:predicted transcriptional regulator
MSKKPYFAIINHQIRLELKLSLNEYCIADCISRFSNRNSWCSITIKELSEFIDLSARQVSRIIKKLSDFEYVELSQNSKKFRITKKWIELIESFDDADKMSVPVEVADKMSVQKKSDSISTNILLNNTNDISTIISKNILVNKYTDPSGLNTSKNKEIKTFGNTEINDVINYLRSKLGMDLDGGSKNRWFASHLLKAVKRNFPNLDAVAKIKEIIDVGYEIPFFKKNLTNFTFLYYNWVKIIKQGEDMKISQPIQNVDDKYQKRLELSKNCTRGCKNGYIQKEINGRDVIILCECCKNL